MFVGLAKKLALFCAGSVCGRDRRDEIARIRGPIMFKNLTVQHVTFVSKRPFSEVVKAFVHNVGRLEEACPWRILNCVEIQGVLTAVKIWHA
jgi:hypothetical protein